MPNDFALERITRDPEICEGKPTIRGMRISVSVILRMLAAGHKREYVQAALSYAAWRSEESEHLLPDT